MTRRHGESRAWPAKRRGAGAGRDVTRLLADFGHRLPAAPEPVVPAKESRLFHYASPKGRRNRNHGWAPAKAPVSTWRMTSDQAPVLWPFISTPGLPPTGAQMGVDLLSGGTFYADPHGWVLRDSVPVTNPNMFIFGKPGRGKSATVKALLLRMMDFGYRALILGDPKDEYQLLCRALGVEPFRIGPGLQTRIIHCRSARLVTAGISSTQKRHKAGPRSFSAAGSPWCADWLAASGSGNTGFRSGPPTRSSSRPHSSS